MFSVVDKFCVIEIFGCVGVAKIVVGGWYFVVVIVGGLLYIWGCGEYG